MVLVTELAVEALDVAMLHRPPRLDQDVVDAAGLRPGHEDAMVNSGPLSVRTAGNLGVCYAGSVRPIATVLKECLGAACASDKVEGIDHRQLASLGQRDKRAIRAVDVLQDLP